MADRIYDRVLDCGCMYSSDGGGGMIPCHYEMPTQEDIDKCIAAHQKWHDSEDYKKFKEECIEKNK